MYDTVSQWLKRPKRSETAKKKRSASEEGRAAEWGGGTALFPSQKCKSAVIPLPWGITILNQGKIHGKFREVKIRGGLCTVKSADARRYDQFRPLIHGRKFPKYYKWVCSVQFPFPETRYKLSAQRIPGSFGRTSVTYDRLMVALTTID